MKRFAWILVSLLLLSGCALSGEPEPAQPPTLPVLPTLPPAPAPTEEATLPPPPPDPAETVLNGLSVEEQVAQLFLIRCNAQTAASDIAQYQFGGLLLFAQDFENQNPESMEQLLSQYQSYAKVPLLIAVDEEGGTVTRISRYPAFRSAAFPSPKTAYQNGGMENALMVEREKCQLLSSLGINVNLGPVCDITTDPQGFMYHRSLGLDPQTTSLYVSRTVQLMAESTIGSVLKHFPGYGNNQDTHIGMAVDARPLEQFQQSDLLPFQAGMDAGCGAVMISHTIVEAFDPQLPASLSPAVHQYIRQEMGYDGVLVTDDLVMQAITDSYGTGQAAVMALQAGNDLLCSSQYLTQYQAVMDALGTGELSYDTVYQAALRVIRWKLALGLIELP